MEVGVKVIVTLCSSGPSSADCRGCIPAKPDGCVGTPHYYVAKLLVRHFT